MNNTIYQHINIERKNKPHRATLCAVKTQDGHIQIGSSICSIKDRFNRRAGRDIALKRALEGEVQDDAWESWEFDEFLLRCMKYFKDVPYSKIKYSYVK